MVFSREDHHGAASLLSLGSSSLCVLSQHEVWKPTHWIYREPSMAELWQNDGRKLVSDLFLSMGHCMLDVT